MSKLSTFGKFVGRYAGELRSAASVFGMILSALPLDPADKADATARLDDLTGAADRIEASLAGLSDVAGLGKDEVLKLIRDEIKKALPDAIGGAVERQVREAMKKVTPPPAS